MTYGSEDTLNHCVRLSQMILTHLQSGYKQIKEMEVFLALSKVMKLPDNLNDQDIEKEIAQNQLFIDEIKNMLAFLKNQLPILSDVYPAVEEYDRLSDIHMKAKDWSDAEYDSVLALHDFFERKGHLVPVLKKNVISVEEYVKRRENHGRSKE